ncbi:cof-like hydrolase [Streptococcus urinalis FB127-CNA-2]|uniref:Cof-like hydrolase n=1 Tax=Streptococcus urinalis 2285-97 TaxID=764291 RepID=G5KCC9_9STRE|nr:Cof-type HAD-IIB family hydrolase [Streptococcus urinalis]EHJ56656.1 Cof-like hydrolase [Streptococcus urinalis 2285-97]EKS19758.1 cof-like hydrolase [Streptococcus urinalis FB127-CNA-2]VEF31335.1 hydrolase [Streptococcus urinalis]
MIKLIAIDLDGTLLNSEKKIPKKNSEAIKAAVEAGVKIVLCTGRPKSGTKPFFEQLGLGLQNEEYVILNNGCSTYSTKNWELVAYHQLTPRQIEALQSLTLSFPEIELTVTGENTYFSVSERVSKLVSDDAKSVFTTCQAASIEAIEASQEILFQAMYMGPEEALDVFEKQYGPELRNAYSPVRSQKHIYEVMPKDVTKATGLRELAVVLGIDPEEIMALGDAANDLEMLQFAGLSVAMGNASQKVKDNCDVITLDNDQAGVGEAIYKYVLNN